MSWLILAILITLLVLLVWEILQVLLTQAPHKTDIRIIAADDIPSSDIQPEIPKIIWSYWQQAPAPELVAHCKANWQRYAPDHEVRMLFKEDVTQWLEPSAINKIFDSLPAYRQADWLRLQLLMRYGGIWIDASTILTQDLSWAHRLQQQHNTEYTGFYINAFTTRIEQPIVENWFMAAVAGSVFITDLAAEFDHAIQISESEYLSELHKQGKIEHVAQGLKANSQLYLIMHVAASVLLDRNPKRYRLALMRAEDSALNFHATLRWRKRHLYARLALSPCPTRVPVLIKLRGCDRRVFEQGLARDWIYSGSFLAKYLHWKK